MMTSNRTATRIAAAAALFALSGLSLATPALAASKADTIHCFGVNSCKGMSDCKSGNHDCKGMNDCKGQGFKALTTKACTAAGGSLSEPSK